MKSINKTSDSHKRAKQLSEESDRLAKIFNPNNFYDNNNINVEKLKQKIIEAKRKMLISKIELRN